MWQLRSETSRFTWRQRRNLFGVLWPWCNNWVDITIVKIFITFLNLLVSLQTTTSEWPYYRGPPPLYLQFPLSPRNVVCQPLIQIVVMYVREMWLLKKIRIIFYKFDLCWNYNNIPITSGSPLYIDTSILLSNYLQSNYLRINKYQPVTTH